jgi:hypothetical protein
MQLEHGGERKAGIREIEILEDLFFNKIKNRHLRIIIRRWRIQPPELSWIPKEYITENLN